MASKAELSEMVQETAGSLRNQRLIKGWGTQATDEQKEKVLADYQEQLEAIPSLKPKGVKYHIEVAKKRLG